MTSTWTKRQNKLFEDALAIYDKDTPDRWQNVARAIGNIKSAEEVKRHFEEMNRDVIRIEAGDLGQFGGSGSSNTNGGSSRGGSSGKQRPYLKSQ